MSKLVQLRQVFGELILSLRRAFENLNNNDGIALKGPTTVNQGDTVSWVITDHDVQHFPDYDMDYGYPSDQQSRVQFHVETH